MLTQGVMAKSGRGRIEIRSIWITSNLNDYRDFSCVKQAFAIEHKTS
ncbi:MAG: hypothetical protein NMNS01_30280 [Nitrosomonas sp.]|nr:MAG: hypothetical protein NMNS01_30280 [Nitrosomonas sp.]